MQDKDKRSALNANKINFLSGKNSNIEKTSLANVKSKYIRDEINSYLPGSQYLKVFGHSKKYLKEFSESDYFFQDKYYAEFLSDILIDPDEDSIFHMCNYIFEKDIEALEKKLTEQKLTDEEKQKFHFDSKEGKISWRFKPCLFVLALPNILRDIFSITLSDFRKLTKEDLDKKPEDLQELCFSNGANQIKSSMIYAYNVLKKKSENENNEFKNSHKTRLNSLKNVVLETEKVGIEKLSTDNLPVDDTEKKFRFINYQKLIYRTISYLDWNFRGLSDLWDEFECCEYFTLKNASPSSISNQYYHQYYTTLTEKPEYLYTFNTLEEFDTAWGSLLSSDYISTEEKLNEFKNKYYKYLFILADGNQDKFAEFLENKAEEKHDPNMLYRCSWRSAILRVISLVLTLIFIIILIVLPFILCGTILEFVLFFLPDVFSLIIPVVALATIYYKEYCKPFFANRTPFEYKYNRYLQNKYPILKPENRDEHFFDESREFQKYKKRITNEKNQFKLIATKYQTHDENIVEESKNPPLLDGIIQTKNEQK